MDLDADGYCDVLSGSWPGELFLFRGGPDGSFAAPEMLKDKDGNVINIGGGIKEQAGGEVMITGNAESKTEKDMDKKDVTVIEYHGKRLEYPAGKQVWVTGTASAAFAADWDGDGDLDLLVGDIRGSVYLIPNEGTAKAYKFGKEQKLSAGGNEVRAQMGDAGPTAADWDGDGDLDLIVGGGDGAVTLYRNTGTPKGPKLAAGEQLVPPGKTAYDSKAPKEPTRGTRAKVCVADFNGDGRPDLLLGDFATQKPDRPEPTPEQKAEQDKARADLTKLYAEYSAAIGKISGASREKEPDKLEKARAELKALQAKMSELRSKAPEEYQTHGWVWFFARLPEGAARR